MQLFRRKPKPPSFTLSEDVVFVIGDSHSRAFAHNGQFFPLFLGPGKQINFVGESQAVHVQSRIEKVLSNFQVRRILTYFGEPDTRWYVGKGWYPWEGEVQFTLEDFRPEIEACAQRYAKVLKWLVDQGFEVACMNVTPTIREDQNALAHYYNTLLAPLCESLGVVYVNINASLFTAEGKLNESYCGDTVHLNNRIQPLVETQLMDAGLIAESGFNQNFDWDHLTIHGEYVYNEKFGCFVPKSSTS